MEKKAIYPSVSQKIHGQSCLLRRNFQYSPPCSYGVMRNLHGINWRGKGTLLPAAAPCLGKESSSGVTPMPITIGGPAEKRTRLPLIFLLQSSLATVLAPIQRVQLLLQNQNAIINSGRLSHPYTGILNCFGRIIWNEGFFSLWRGHGSYLMGLFSYRMLNSRVIASASSPDLLKDPLTRILVYVFGTCATRLLVHPFCYAEIRLANDVISNTGQRQFSGIIDVCWKTFMTDGIRGLYRGLGINLFAVGMDPVIKNFILPAIKPRSLSYQSNFLEVEHLQMHLNGVLSNMVTYPMYTVSRRMMMSSGEGETAKYKNTLDAFLQILKKEGFKSFYKGMGAEILRLTFGFCLLEALYCIVRAKKKEKKTGDGGGNRAPNAVRLTWTDANVGSHNSEKK